jgi:uncharacterized membrane protein
MSSSTIGNRVVTSSFAVAAAALFVSACGGNAQPPADASAATANGDTVKCLGIHECKGQSQCGVEGGHACAGQNECKGKGWIKVAPAECDAKGGTVQS